MALKRIAKIKLQAMGFVKRSLWVIAALPLGVQAETGQSSRLSTSTSATMHTATQAFTFGPQFQYFDYKESFEDFPPEDGGIHKSEERGLVPGFIFGYELYPKMSHFFVHPTLALTMGNVFYDGATQSGIPTTSQSGLSILQLQTLMGFYFGDRGDSTLEFYSGFTIRRWHRTLDRGKPTEFDETYTSVYLPAGIRWIYPLSTDIRIAPGAEVGIPLGSTFKVVLPMALFDLEVSNSLRTTASWKFQLPLTYEIEPSLGMTLNPFVESHAYQTSYIASLAEDLTIYEPASHTTQVGLQLQINYLF